VIIYYTINDYPLIWYSRFTQYHIFLFPVKNTKDLWFCHKTSNDDSYTDWESCL
jgi:hypothetical protein